MQPLPLDYIVETDRCRLRAPRAEDIPWVFEASRAPGFCDGMAWEPPAAVEELAEPWRRSIESWRAGLDYSFTIERKADGAFLGRISIRSAGKPPGCWNIGFWLHPRHQGVGYMTEAARAVLRLGFDVLGAEEIEACHAVGNERSARVLRSVGMSFAERLPQGLKKQGQWVPEIRMSRRRTSWPDPSGA